MNKERRNQLLDIASDLENVIADIDMVRCDEEDAYYSLPDSLQYSSRGDAMQEAIDEMDSISRELDDFVDRLKAIANKK